MTLYIIGGASRSGKTQLALKMLREHGIPYFSLDFLTNAMHHGFPNLGVCHEQDAKTRAQGLWPGVRAMMQALAEDDVTYLIEGEALRPADVAEFLRSFPDKDICACFLGYAQADIEEKICQTRGFISDDNDWSASLSDRDRHKLILDGIAFSKYLKKECAEYDLPYIDTSQDFEVKIEGVINSLIKP